MAMHVFQKWDHHQESGFAKVIQQKI